MQKIKKTKVLKLKTSNGVKVSIIKRKKVSWFEKEIERLDKKK